MASSLERNAARRRAHKMAQLLELGFEAPEVSPLVTESVPVGHGTWKVSQVRPAMGTVVAVSALHASPDLAEEAIGGAFEEMDRLIDLLNRYDPASAVSVLNQQGSLRDVPPEVDLVVGRSMDMHRLSGGAFDVTVKPLVDLFRDSVTAEPLAGPSGDELAERVDEVIELVGSEAIERRPGRIAFRRGGMGVTLDGIAKGHVVDAMAAVLSGHGASSFLINAGGDVRSAGRRDGRMPWTVAVQDPDKRDRFPAVVEMVDGAIATSGSYEVYFDRERLTHHVVSAAGRSPTDSTSVTVMAPTAIEADALATAAFVMGPRRALRFIGRLEGRECLIVDAGGRPLRSAGWPTAASTPFPTAETPLSAPDTPDS